MKRVSQAFLEKVAADNNRLIEFDNASNRAILRVSGQTFYAELTYQPKHRAPVSVDSWSCNYPLCAHPIPSVAQVAHTPTHRRDMEAVTS